MRKFKYNTLLPAIATVAVVCTIQLSIANPSLTAGTWVDISPSQVAFGNNVFTQGLAVDPVNPDIIYLCVSAFDVSQAGLFKTTDGGSNWKRIGRITAGTRCADTIDEPIRVRINPKNTQQLYCGDGVRGCSGGIWVSNDGGETWTMPDAFATWEKSLGTTDVYDVAVDPTDFNHLLLSFHSAWRQSGAGALESTDGGASWIPHGPVGSSGAGMSIAFLYDPALGIGNSNTWLLGTQGDGYWRTTDGGVNWAKVSNTCIQHGGGTIYYASTSTASKTALYASGTPRNLRSTNNGATWIEIGPSGGTTCIYGDGTTLYTMSAFGPAPFIKSPETDGITWTNFNSQQFVQGPFEMGIDPVKGILYTASWNAGIWALKISNYSGVTKAESLIKCETQTAAVRGRYVTKGAVLQLGPAMAGKMAHVYNVNGTLVQRAIADQQGNIKLDKISGNRQTLVVKIGN